MSNILFYVKIKILKYNKLFFINMNKIESATPGVKDENTKEAMNERQKIMIECENIRVNKEREKEYNDPFNKLMIKNRLKSYYEMNSDKIQGKVDFEEWYKNTHENSCTPSYNTCFDRLTYH